MFKYLEILFIYLDADPIPRAIRRKGIANPSENTDRRNAPWATLVELAARVRIVPNIGPTQGVQPKANVAPKMKELLGVPGFNDLRILELPNFSRKLNPWNLNTSSMKRPNMITNMPPILESHSL